MSDLIFFLKGEGEMSTRIFSVGALSHAVRAGDPRRFHLDLKKDRVKILDNASALAAAGLVDLKNFQTTEIKNKACVSYTDFHCHLVLRSIAHYLRRRLRISLPNRERIVRGVIESLMDSTPMYVMRRDITSFYESIEVAPLRNRLLFDLANSLRVRQYVSDYFENHCSANTHGLPRGVGLSALFSELAMANFDQAVRKIPGVYKYYRFADDIVVFSFRPTSEISSLIEGCLPKKMKFNLTKLEDIEINQATKDAARSVSFEYLGYRFSTTNQCGQKEGRKVEVAIANKKISRLKSRVILSLKSYSRNSDFGLLRDRLLYISSNYTVTRNGFASDKGAAYVKSGIFYNYKQCGTYEFSQRRLNKLQSAASELKAVDGFFHSLLRGAGSGFAPILRARLSPAQLNNLRKISFHKGYTERMAVRFTSQRVNEIKMAWLHHA